MPVFLLTDIEQSTVKWEKHRSLMSAVLARHDAIMQETVARYGGRIFKHTGDGVFAVFEDGKPLSCALEIQQRFGSEDWGAIGELRVRVSLHAGSAESRENDYFGPAVNLTARVNDATWGGQVLLTAEAKKSCALPPGAALLDLGVHQLHGLDEPARIYQLMHSQLPLKEFPAIHSLSSHPNNLPAEPSPFFGRREEIDTAARLLRKRECRIVNIVGPGGVGKTRVALQVAASVLHNFQHGVYLVPLAPLTVGSVQFMVITIADALKFNFYSKDDPKIQLIDYLREKEMLLIMDNFEHLPDEAELMADITEAAPRVKFLVTSRARLQLKGEYLCELTGMSVPGTADPAGIAASDPVMLFAQCARRVRPDFALADTDLVSVARICRAVDGMPLGIELAASWTRMLSCAEILQELEKSLSFLSTDMQDVPRRHRSLQAVFDYSWELLNKKEQTVFKRLSIFRNGFLRSAAEKIAGATLLDLTTLTDKSLIRRNPAGRYQVLKTVRLFAAEKLANNDADRAATQVQFCRYFADQLKMPPIIKDWSAIQALIETVAGDIENVRAAWQLAADNGLSAELNQMLPALYWYLENMSHFFEGKEIFQAALAKLEPAAPGEMAGVTHRIACRLGAFLQRLTEYEAARPLFEKSLAYFRTVGPPAETAFALNELGIIAYKQGKYESALEFYGESRTIREAINDGIGLSATLNNLGILRYTMGDSRAGCDLHEQALALRTRLNHRYGMASSMNNLANILVDMKNYEKALALYNRSLELRRGLKDRNGIASCLNNLGSLYFQMDEREKARAFFMESLQLKREIGDQASLLQTLNNLADLAIAFGNFSETREYLKSSMAIALRSRALSLIIEVLEIKAALFLKEKQPDRALQTLAIIFKNAGTKSSTLRRTESTLQEIRSSLAPERVDEILKTTGDMKIDEIVKLIGSGFFD